MPRTLDLQPCSTHVHHTETGKMTIGQEERPTNRMCSQIRSLMDRQANIRNMSVIAHGKSLRSTWVPPSHPSLDKRRY